MTLISGRTRKLDITYYSIQARCKITPAAAYNFIGRLARSPARLPCCCMSPNAGMLSCLLLIFLHNKQACINSVHFRPLLQFFCVDPVPPSIVLFPSSVLVAFVQIWMGLCQTTT